MNSTRLLNNSSGFFYLVLIIFLAAACSPSRKVPTETVKVLESKITEREVYRGSITKLCDLIHTSLNVAFDIPAKKLIGTAELTMKPYFYKTNMLYLDARGMDIKEVMIVRSGKHEELMYRYENDSIKITLDKYYSASDTFKVFIDYIANPEEVEAKGGTAITSNKGLYFINTDGLDPSKPEQIWTQGETRSNSVWFPTIDHPNQKSTQEIYITVDSSFITLSNGLLISSITNSQNGTRTDYWRQDLPHAPYLFMMAIGKYAVVKDKWRDMDVTYYVEPAFEKYARSIFGNTPEMIQFFSDRLGVDYPWAKYAQVVVRDYVSGAMENTTASVFGEFMHMDDRELLDENYEQVISHELFHQWFGDYVTMESWSNLPLNESFATYSEYLWSEYKYGRDEADYNGQSDLATYMREARLKQVDLVRFDYRIQDDMFDHHSYAKGGRVLHMLRRYTGDAAFYSALKLYLQRHKFGTVEMHDLRLAFEEVTGEDLNWFFNQWFYDKGHPSLKISYEYDAVLMQQQMTVEQLQNLETTPLYKLPVDVDVYESGKITRYRIVLEKQKETFSFTVASKPDLVNFDAQKMLLCTKTDNHTDDEWVFMHKNALLYLDRFESLTKLSESSAPAIIKEEVIQLALRDKHRNIRVKAIEALSALGKEAVSNNKSTLIDLAMHDDNAIVRLDALDLVSLSFDKDQDVRDLVLKSTNDPSYSVTSLALSRLAETNEKTAYELVNKMQNDSNVNVRGVVAEFYMYYGSDDQYEYMTEQLSQNSGSELYTAVQDYTRYLMRCSPKVASKGLDELSKIGFNNSLWYVRFSAVQSLSEMQKSYGKKSSNEPEPNQVLTDRNEIEIENVRKKAGVLLVKVKEQEKDENLLRIYGKKE